MMISPITKQTDDPDQPACGRIQGNQSGIRLGIGPVVLRRGHRSVGTALWRFPITLSERGAHRGVVPIRAVASMGAPGVRRATMHG